MRGALKDILVVAVEQAVAAPYCSSRLADAGARVIKVERPEGDFARHYDAVAGGHSAYFVWLNRGKESLKLDFKQPDDAALLDRILARADVYIQNLAPGAAERAGIGSDELRRRHPRLITCDISGYGDDERVSHMRAYDMLIQAEVGLASITGTPEAPGRVGVSVADISCGMYAAGAILEALHERYRTGTGKGLKVSLFDALADWMAVPLLYHAAGRPPGRIGLHHPVLAPYGAYAARGGELIVLSIQNAREWQRFCEHVLERPDLAEHELFHDNQARVANRQALDSEIEAVFSAHDRETLVERLKRGRVAYGAVNSLDDLAQHPALRLVPQPIPGGSIDVVAPPARVAGEAPEFAPVPELGQHSRAIAKEFAAGESDGAE
ncbi:MAG TPA: CaiB/BaiF CoA-transferase family protein [Alphaproteobacteria bacterium]|jgi:crotonobetainyl-CoA:carnitine CoA-transferase CaiB-like acyl-CoA transferase|nr:CaiB/BaiF CoA-transferase family protein [Alphaproteobacteria bacterium]MDP6268846.1 CaiB/BaiF CoA-transferase family protein [Alphaproteobacteria bacterium]MDP7164329.1 CaiB/BaiF CoA-transferase family protein [Alphaproteobacteria bacterium]MDP7429447.1 CaiB/BaiF CoA-transferase family protein [Alphaproteobacteria bacterium]HJM51017.1 CaiB/BaiF CoA-transferase family protein [Alphaproteobacteria bacterium]